MDCNFMVTCFHKGHTETIAYFVDVTNAVDFCNLQDSKGGTIEHTVIFIPRASIVYSINTGSVLTNKVSNFVD